MLAVIAATIADSLRTEILVDEPLPRVIRFATGQTGGVYLPAYAGGVEVGPCLLDSGTDSKRIPISPAAAHAANLRKPLWPRWSFVQGAYGWVVRTNRRGESLKVGPVHIRHPGYVVLAEMDDWTMSPTGGGPASICGGAILAKALVEIDW